MNDEVTETLRAHRAALLLWAVGRWREEVQHRPMVNKNRRALDDAWRQVMRFAGGDPDALVGPAHDALIELAMVDAGGDKRAGPSAVAVCDA